MATVILGAAGAAIGGAVGGTVLGVGAAAIGRYVGASIGHRIDQRLMGSSSAYSVETGKIDTIAFTSVGEGQPIVRVFGRMRVNAHVIWAAQIQEHVTEQSQSSGGGGKGSAPKTTVTQKVHTYSLSFAVGLCDGEISGIGRIWANGQELAADKMSYSLYKGGENQLPDPLIEAHEGCAPAFQGTAYLVFEDLDLTQFGNRLPQLAIEVIRPVSPDVPKHDDELSELIQGVAMIPGSGEYALSTTPAYLDKGRGKTKAANINSPSGKTDILTSLDQLNTELPRSKATSLVVSWFGTDLRCAACEIEPRVEGRGDRDAHGHPWVVAGLGRQGAKVVPYENGAPVYGGTPTDRSVKEAITALKAAGQDVVFYPFIMMCQQKENGLADPWTGTDGQAVLPWRGRITTSLAPQVSGTPDGTAAAKAEVEKFFSGGEWNYSRFILHYAQLCKEAGGVDAFCIGSEMRGLTQVRDDSGFPAVQALKDLAQKVRAILGPNCKIGYAADWSEYFGYTPQDGSGDRYFHLDPLWADRNIDFIGIDNYMPLTDWRDAPLPNPDGDAYKSPYDGAYLRNNIEGGEGFDWYYASDEDRVAAKRTPITDGTYGEPWVWRYKDIRNWWSNAHYERINGQRMAQATDWVPQSKPIWFTELGCAALDKAANQPNVFMDPKSSESSSPYFSNGLLDETMQMRFLQSVTQYWKDPSVNPVSNIYQGSMIDTQRIFIWAWDARPFPWFPNRKSVWSDGDNYMSGHWITGRGGACSLAAVIAEICHQAGVENYDVSGVYGVVAGYSPGPQDTPRGALQSLMLAYGVEGAEQDGKIVFSMRGQGQLHVVDPMRVVVQDDQSTGVERTRASSASQVDMVRFGFIAQGEDFTPVVEEAHHSAHEGARAEGTELRLLLPRGQGRAIAERWLAESRLARETIRFSLPPSDRDILTGDYIQFSGREDEEWRIDRREIIGALEFEATRCDRPLYDTRTIAGVDAAPEPRLNTPVPMRIHALDLPLLRADDDPLAPHLSVDSDPWPSSAAVFSSPEDSGYRLAMTISQKANQGVTRSELAPLIPALIHQGAELSIDVSGALASVSATGIDNGQNAAALWHESQGEWEIIQFQRAQLTEDGLYRLRGIIRGARGTAHLCQYPVAVDAAFVLLDGAQRQFTDDTLEQGQKRYLRVGPATQSYDHATYQSIELTCQALGLRPFPVVHVAAQKHAGHLQLSWQRQTRWSGESWNGIDVPLGEEQELYALRFLSAGQEVLSTTAAQPEFLLEAQDWEKADTVEIAQLSQRYGPGVVKVLSLPPT